MSFTSKVKTELANIDETKLEMISELSAIIRNSSTITDKILITSENATSAKLVYKLIKELYNINASVTIRKRYNFNKNYTYLIEVKNLEILHDLGLLTNNEVQNIPANYIVDDDELIRAYLRGVFISSGSVNDPKTSRYHMEISFDNEEYSNFILNLINEYYLNAKILKRDNKYMIYIKEAEKISDFLRVIKAMNAVLYYEDIRIYRDHKNMTNRLNNCEQANVDKIIMTSSKHINDIIFLRENDYFDLLDDKLKEAAIYREKYPDSSLVELSEIISMETGNILTKSGLHHRLKKIELLADKMRCKK
jgi:hypothetical protein